MYALITASIVAACLASAPGALAHEAAETARAAAWTWDPGILASLIVACLWYGVGFLRMKRRDATAHILGRRHATAFVSGIAILVAALVSPLHELGEQLLSMHMVQHLLLLFAAPVALVYSRPVIAFLWALAPGPRKRLGRLWTGLGMTGVMRVLMNPLVVWALFCGGFIVWHLPKLYQWALENEGVHTLEHLSFFVTALMFWSLVIEPSGQRRVGYGGTLLLIVHTAILSGMPGALIALSPRPLYPAYTASVAAWGLTLMQDQQLAGLIMWIPCGLVYLAAFCVVFVLWLNEAERSPGAAVRHAGPTALLAVPLMLLLSGCGQGNPQPESGSTGGDAQRGAALIRANGCGTCHTIPGIEDATGLVGPSLDHMRNRVYIAGLLRNTPDNMERWLKNPQAIVPGNVMPDMRLSARDARDVTAFLYSLQ